MYWAQDYSCNQGQLFAPNSKILLVTSQSAPSVKASLCGLACRLPACLFSASASELPAPLLYTLSHIPRHKAHSHWSPACAGWEQVLAISHGAAPLQAVLPAHWCPAVTATDPGTYIKKHNCFYTDPEGEAGSFSVIQSKPGLDSKYCCVCIRMNWGE